MPKKKFKTAQKKLSQLRQEALIDLEKKHQPALKYLKKKKLLLPGLGQQSKKLLAGATLAGSLLLGPLKGAAPLLEKPPEERLKVGLATAEEVNNALKEKLAGLLPETIGKLSEEQEKEICQAIEEVLGIEVCSRLEGNELNHAYAWTGYEQHLQRYPGDSLEEHDEEQVAGIAPGLGAWGYFAASKEMMSREEYLREKYYVAVQTLYLPEWPDKYQELYEWYQYRKMIMINPENGTACVAVVGDAGPAEWTGKQFGGSPEVMKALDLHLEMRKGKVLLLFVKDPNNEIPLGPINFNVQKGQPEVA